MKKIRIILVNPDLKHVSERFIEPTRDAFAQAMGLDAGEYQQESTCWDEVTNTLPLDDEARYVDVGGDGTLRFKIGLSEKSESMSGLIGIHGGEDEDEEGNDILLEPTITVKQVQAKVIWGSE